MTSSFGPIHRGARTRLAKFKILFYFDEMVGILDIFISKEVRQVWWACNRQLQWFIPSRHLEKLWPLVYPNTICPGPRVIRTLDPSEIGPLAQLRSDPGPKWVRARAQMRSGPAPKWDLAQGTNEIWPPPKWDRAPCPNENGLQAQMRSSPRLKWDRAPGPNEIRPRIQKRSGARVQVR